MRRFIIIIILLCCSAASAQTKEALELNRAGIENGKAGRYTESLSSFNKALVLYDKESAKSIHNIGWLYDLRGDTENALIFYEEALRRNPDQVHTLERAGFLLYKSGSLEKGILYGEKVMKLDPVNQEVIKWLPDAYAQMFKLKEKKINETAAEKEQQKIVEQVKEQKKEEKKQRRYLTATFDTVIRSSYQHKGKTGFGYTSTDSYLLKMPFLASIDFTPTDEWEIKGQTGVPYWGSLIPDLTWWSEKLEGYFYQKNYFLGIGIMGNHYGGSSVFGTKENLSDYKMGIIIGKFQERSRLDIILYPRMFPADTGAAKGKTMDVDSAEVSYSYILTDAYRLYGRMKMTDFYFFDNAAAVSNYYGVYDFTAGFGLYDKPASPYLFRFEFTEKMYLKNLNNKHPYSYANGQGLFGLDAYHWFKGRPLSGIQTFGTVLSFYAQEQIVPHLFVYQKISMEIVPPSQGADDFCLQLGVGGTY